MAKAKSKKITIEDALVPVEEQPYEVSDNWCWVKPLSIIEIEYGKGLPTKKLTEDGYPVFGANGQIGYYSEYMLEKPMALMSCRGAYSGTMNLSLPYSFVTSNSLIMKDKGAFISEKYIYYMFSALNTGSLVSGSAQPQVTVQAFSDFAVPLPPLPEQQRIVEQIESLFSKLDEAKTKAQEAIDSYDMRVKAILDKAFKGEYSKNWRDNNNVSLADWSDSHINEVCIPRAGYAFDSKKFTSEGYQVIRMGNLYAGELDLTRSPVFISEEDVDDNVLSRSLVHDGDILITLTGTKYKRDYGYAVCIEGNPDLLVNQRILCLTPTEKINKDYLLFYLRSEVFRDIFFSCETGGVNQGNVSSKFVENIEIKLPSLEEQRVIAALLRSVMDKERQAKEASVCIIEEIDVMKKSILAKAFRGELGTNNPMEESSMELLKQIIE